MSAVAAPASTGSTTPEIPSSSTELSRMVSQLLERLRDILDADSEPEEKAFTVTKTPDGGTLITANSTFGDNGTLIGGKFREGVLTALGWSPQDANPDTQACIQVGDSTRTIRRDDFLEGLKKAE